MFSGYTFAVDVREHMIWTWDDRLEGTPAGSVAGLSSAAERGGRFSDICLANMDSCN